MYEKIRCTMSYFNYDIIEVVTTNGNIVTFDRDNISKSSPGLNGLHMKKGDNYYLIKPEDEPAILEPIPRQKQEIRLAEEALLEQGFEVDLISQVSVMGQEWRGVQLDLYGGGN